MTSFWRTISEPPSTAWGLLEQALGNHADAWTTISRIYAPLVYSWARRFGLSDSDASDVTQEVFLRVFLKLNTYARKLGRFRGWLKVITRNVVFELLRKQKVSPALIGQALLEEFPESHDQESQDSDLESIPNEVLQRALEVIRHRFKEQTFQAAWRTLALGLLPSDVAKGLGISVGAVYIAKSRVLRELRRLLDGLEFDNQA